MRTLSLLMISLALSSAQGATSESMRYVMGTLLKTQVTAQTNALANETGEKIFMEVNKWDQLLSTFRSDSDISTLNRLSGQWVKLSTSALEILQTSVNYAKITNGIFDPTIGALVDLWGFEKESSRIPSSYEIKKTLPQVNYHLLEINASERGARLTQKRMAINLGAIGKGYALDRALEIVKNSQGVHSVTMNFGGQILFWNRKIPPEGHKVILRDFPEVSFHWKKNGSVATSSQSERYVVGPSFAQGAGKQNPSQKRYGHILDPRTGYPAEKTQTAVVLAETATDADVYATAVFILGVQDGLKLTEERKGIEALIQYQDEDGNFLTQTSSGWPHSDD